ncbi:hypothetical protein AB5N19_01854 [Seiridium cardinale]
MSAHSLGSSESMYSSTTMGPSPSAAPTLFLPHSAMTSTMSGHSAVVNTAVDAITTGTGSQPISASAHQKDIAAAATPTDTSDILIEVKAPYSEKAQSDLEPDPYGRVDPKSGLNDCEIAGLVIGCILVFLILVYLGLKYMVLRNAKEQIDWERGVRDLRDWLDSDRDMVRDWRHDLRRDWRDHRHRVD